MRVSADLETLIGIALQDPLRWHEYVEREGAIVCQMLSNTCQAILNIIVREQMKHRIRWKDYQAKFPGS